MFLPKNLPDLLRQAGLNVIEISGWQTRGRPASTGTFEPVGVLNHHTGSEDRSGDLADDLAYAKWLATQGRPDLPPPLCNLSLSYEGTVYVIAAGRANHAGKAKPSGSVAGGDGNSLYVGIEWMLSGTQTIPEEMMQVAATLNAVLLHILGSSEQAVSCHYQTSVTGKWDIGDPNGIPFNGHKVLDVDKFRTRVKKATHDLYDKPEPPVKNDLKVQVLKKVRLNGTIDGHDPLVVVFRICGPQGWFRVVFVTVNWGRGYKPGEFKQNVLNVLDYTDERQYVIIAVQELDEADSAPEHKVFKAEMEPGTTLVCFETREPLAISPETEVRRERKVMTMDSGVNIGVPLTGPRRWFVSCIVTIEGVRIFCGNQHPHHVPKDANPKERVKVKAAKLEGVQVTRKEVRLGLRLADLAIYGGDMNDAAYPKAVPQEKTAWTVGLDTIRYALPQKGN